MANEHESMIAPPLRPYPEIDYASHPAFGNGARVGDAAGRRIAAEIEAIDAVLDPVRSGERPSPVGDERTRLEAQIDGHLAAIALAARDVTDDHPTMASSIAKAMSFVRPELLDEAAYAGGRAHATHWAPPGSRMAEVAAAVDEAGAFVCKISAERRSRVEELLEPLRGECRAKRESGWLGKITLSIPQRGLVWETLCDALDDAGLREGLAVYAGHELVFHFAELQFSYAEQTWWRDGFADVGLSTSPYVYFHNDHSFDMLKAILYLGDVTERQGPFEFVPGSHRWHRSPTATRLVKSMDRANLETFGGQSSTRGYYRPHFESAEFRRLVSRLPSPLNQTSHFGDDVLPDSELAGMLDRDRVTCLSTDVDCIVFDGHSLAHRGGLVAEGERWAIQLGFRKPKPTTPSKRKNIPARAEALVRSRLRHVPAARKAKKLLTRTFGTQKVALEPDVARQRDEARRILAGTRLVAADVGAARGLQRHWAAFEGVAQIYAFEPNAASLDALREEFAAKPNPETYTLLQTALSGSGGQRTLHIHEPTSGSSLLNINLEPDSPILGYLRPAFDQVGAEQIETSTLAEVLDEHGEDAVHVAKLDVQGAELEVLEGLGAKRLGKTLLVEAEVNTMEVYIGQSTLADFHTFCSDHGLQLFDARPVRTHASRDGRVFGYHEEVFKTPADTRDINARIWHFDMVYLRSKEQLVADRDPDQIRRQIVAFCGYGFFAEAYQLAERAKAARVLDIFSSRDVMSGIEDWFGAARRR